jgi:hypothetical protein
LAPRLRRFSTERDDDSTTTLLVLLLVATTLIFTLSLKGDSHAP